MGIPINQHMDGSTYPDPIFWGDAGGTSPTFNPSASPSGTLSGNTVCVPYSSNVAYAPGSGPVPNQPEAWNVEPLPTTAPQTEEFEFLARPGLRRLAARARFQEVPAARNVAESRPQGPSGGTLAGGRTFRPVPSATNVEETKPAPPSGGVSATMAYHVAMREE